MMVKNNKMINKKLIKNFFYKHSINALYRPSKLAIAEVANMSGGQDILYHNVATETDHTVHSPFQAIRSLQGTPNNF